MTIPPPTGLCMAQETAGGDIVHDDDGRIGAMGAPVELERQYGVTSIDDVFLRLARPEGS